VARYWWGTEKEVSGRLRLEVELMQASFEDTFRLERDKAILFWIGTIDINLLGISQREHTLKIVYPEKYPSLAPEAYVLSPYIYSQKHQFEDGQLCLFNPKDGIEFGWNPATSTAVTVASWAIEWLYTYYTWRKTGEWIGKEEEIQKMGKRWRGRR
jgi:ubiquitin-protein ligase